MTICPFKKFNKIFGEPGKGIHKLHILNTALGDYIGTIIGALLLTYITGVPLVLTTIFLFIFGLICHILFDIPTSAVKYLGIRCK